MRYIKLLLILFIIFCGCSAWDISKKVPEFRLIKRFSNKINKETGLVLFCYGINNSLPKNYQIKNGTANFSVSYKLYRTQKDIISLEDARCLLISVAESFLEEINSDPEIRNDLDVYPFRNDRIGISIVFVDENDVNLGNGGISDIYFSHGKITYERYEILKYEKPIPSGKHFTVLKETYPEALDIVKKSGCLKNL